MGTYHDVVTRHGVYLQLKAGNNGNEFGLFKEGSVIPNRDEKGELTGKPIPDGLYLVPDGYVVVRDGKVLDAGTNVFDSWGEPASKDRAFINALNDEQVAQIIDAARAVKYEDAGTRHLGAPGLNHIRRDLKGSAALCVCSPSAYEHMHLLVNGFTVVSPYPELHPDISWFKFMGSLFVRDKSLTGGQMRCITVGNWLETKGTDPSNWLAISMP